MFVNPPYPNLTYPNLPKPNLPLTTLTNSYQHLPTLTNPCQPLPTLTNPYQPLPTLTNHNQYCHSKKKDIRNWIYNNKLWTWHQDSNNFTQTRINFLINSTAMSKASTNNTKFNNCSQSRLTFPRTRQFASKNRWRCFQSGRRNSNPTKLSCERIQQIRRRHIGPKNRLAELTF